MEFLNKILILRTLTAVLALTLTPPAFAQMADADDGLVCEHIGTNDWGSGFIGGIRVTNAGSTAIDGWVVCWEYVNGVEINHIWNIGDFTTASNSHCVTDAGWNSVISPGQSTEFGFQGTIFAGGGTGKFKITVCEAGSQPP